MNTPRNKSPKKSLFTKRGAQGPGRGPAKGAPNAGRPPAEYIEWLRGVLESPACKKAIETVLKDPDHPAFAKLQQSCSDRAYGKPLQEVQASGDVNIRVVYDDSRS